MNEGAPFNRGHKTCQYAEDIGISVANTEVEAIKDFHLRGFLCPSVKCGNGIPCICIEEAGK